MVRRRKKTKPSKAMPSGFARGIKFYLDSATGVPIYRQIIRQIEYAILSGRMRSGDRLPTIRTLAAELKTNPNTIAKAYSELEIRGILTTQIGSGTFISNKKPAKTKNSFNRKINVMLTRFIHEMHDLGIDKKKLIELISFYRE